MSASSSSPDARPLRADAQRNREALVASARAALTTAGSPFTLEAVARDAGVGIGTLYRHFPARDALVEAVYSAELDALTDRAATLLDAMEPEAALREWASRYAEFSATKHGMMDTLRAGRTGDAIPVSGTRERINSAIAPLLTAGVRAGTLRDDVEPDDVTALLLGVLLSTATNGATDQTARLLDLVLDALRPTPHSARDGAPTD